ncbi:MAG: hypothetical protein RLZZ216_896 [Cyanobacteriota bacterium]
MANTLPFFCRGILIQQPQVLSGIQAQLDQVLLAIPSLPRTERRIIVAKLQRQAIPVLQVPSVDDIISGRARIDPLRPVAIEDLLGRDPVPPVPELLGQKGFQGATSSPWGMGQSAASAAFRPRVWWLWRLRPAAL